MFFAPGGSRVGHDHVEPRHQAVEQRRPLGRVGLQAPRRGQQRGLPSFAHQMPQPGRSGQALVDGQSIGDAQHLAHIAELQIEVEQQGLVAQFARDHGGEHGHRALARTSAAADHRQQESLPRRGGSRRHDASLAFEALFGGGIRHGFEGIGIPVSPRPTRESLRRGSALFRRRSHRHRKGALSGHQ